MTSYDQKGISLAVGLSCLAGYVDATGFLATGGHFVSFMSGNSTKLSIAASEKNIQLAGLILGIICLFVLGVMLGMVTSRRGGERRKMRVLTLVTVILILAAITHSFKVSYLSTALMVVAMGAENAVFQRDGEVSIGLTYMTGTLVKLGQQLTALFTGGSRTAWIPYALHWLGLVSGAILGGIGHAALKEFTLWPAVGAAVGLCAYSMQFKVIEPNSLVQSEIN